MREFTKAEIKRYDSLDERLKCIVDQVRINHKLDVFIIDGHRDEKRQNEAVAGGFSKVKYPNGKHNKWPSQAVDLGPYPLDWSNKKGFVDVYHAVMKASKELNIKIRAGADFNQDGDLTNDKFIDLPHFELVY